MNPTRPISFMTKAFIASPGCGPAGPPNARPALLPSVCYPALSE